MAGRIEAEVEKIVEELLENTALELVAVDYVKERDWYLRVFIDKEGGVDLDEAQRYSRRVVWALSLPGKTAPVTAGEIIAQTMIHLLEERGVSS